MCKRVFVYIYYREKIHTCCARRRSRDFQNRFSCAVIMVYHNRQPHTHTHTQTHTHTHTHTCVCVCVRRGVAPTNSHEHRHRHHDFQNRFSCANILAYHTILPHRHINTHTHIHAHTRMISVHLRIYIFTYTYIYTFISPVNYSKAVPTFG